MPRDPRPTKDLSDVAAWPLYDGFDEITIKVSSYAADGEYPSEFQAIVKHRNRTLVWGCGVDPNPLQALETAIRTAYERSWQGEDPETEEADPSIEDLLS